MQDKATLITKSELQEALKLRGVFGKLVASAAMQAIGLNKANEYYQQCAGGNTFDFSARAMKVMDIKYDLKPEQLDNVPREGGFVMLANHHFGGVDGMMTFDVIGHIRPDLHSVSTFLLGKVPEINPAMFSVNPFTNGVGGGQGSVGGMRQALAHVRNGGCIQLFPAGEVATWQSAANRTALEKGIVEDCPWPISIVKFIRMCKCPVLPVYFEGSNSKHFHRVGKIHPMLRTLNLVKETVKKAGSTIPMRIGKPISVAEMDEYESLEDLYGFLRNRIYAMQAEFEPKRSGHPCDLKQDDSSDKQLVTIRFCEACPKAIQSLIVWFFTQHYSVPAASGITVPRSYFVPYFRNVRPDQLLTHTDTVEKFDHLLREITDGAYSLPPQVMELFSNGAKVVCFNADKASAPALDGLVLLPPK